jgi:hypothetical protein
MDEIGELERIAHEEHRCIVAYQVPVAFLGVKLQREASRVTRRIGRAHLSCHSGKSSEHFTGIAGFGKQPGACVTGDITGYRKRAASAGALGVHNTLRHSLAVEVRHFFHELIILHQHRPAWPRSL